MCVRCRVQSVSRSEAISGHSVKRNSVVSGYVEIQAGTYLNPSSVAIELSRQFGLVIPANTITVTYNVNLNRYLFIDSALISGQLTLYPINGTSTGGAPVLVVQNSIGPSLKLLNAPMNVTQPINIDTLSGNLVVAAAVLGDYGNYGGDIPVNNFAEKIFGNTIASDVVLVECSIYLSLGQLNGDTLILPPDESGENKNIPPIFCQVPNNTIVGSQFTKTLLSQPSVWSGVQFYNPPVSTVNKLDVRWYDEKGVLIDILDNCFTLRIYYFQKRNGTTAFSTSVFNYAASGTIDSNFSNN